MIAAMSLDKQHLLNINILAGWSRDWAGVKKKFIWLFFRVFLNLWLGNQWFAPWIPVVFRHFRGFLDFR